MAWSYHTGITVPGITTGSAYSAYDAVGSRFEIPLSIGNRGGAGYSFALIDGATANAALNLHLFSSAQSASPNGGTFTIADADRNFYLGYVEFAAGDWITAGADRNVNQVLNPGLGFHCHDSAYRSVWGQFQAPSTPEWGDSASAMTLIVNSMMD
jgi:hypothetical protein